MAWFFRIASYNECKIPKVYVMEFFTNKEKISSFEILPNVPGRSK